MKRLVRTAAVAWVLGLALCGFGYWWSLDAPPPDTSDLQVERPEIPEDENGWTYFVRAAETVDIPEDTYSSERVEQLLDGEMWDEALARELIERNEEAFALWQRGLDCATALMSREEALDMDFIPPFGRMRKLAMLASLRAEYRHRQERDEAAFADGVRVVRFGHMIIGTKGPLVNYLIGAALVGTGCRKLRQMLPEAGLTPDGLNSYAEELGRYAPTGDALADTYRLEYEDNAQYLDMTISLMQAEMDSHEDIPTLVFQRNRTLRMLAQFARVQVRNAPRIYADRDLSGMPDLPEPGARWATVRLLLSRNPVGRVFALMLKPVLSTQHQHRCEWELEVSATRVLMALKAYKAENGALPVSLDDLVPEYIAEVPRDPFDGQPLRYSREKEIIYSVGEDLEDSGGAAEDTEEGEGADPTFRIAF